MRIDVGGTRVISVPPPTIRQSRLNGGQVIFHIVRVQFSKPMVTVAQTYFYTVLTDQTLNTLLQG